MKLAPHLLPQISVAAYSYMALMPLIQPPVMKLLTTPEERRDLSGRLFALIETGAVKIAIGQTLPLDRAADAHRALEARQTTGSTVLTV